jgi:hypothetical protein
MYYVYSYIDPTTNQIIYIGKGKKNRAYFHLKPQTKGKQSRFKNKVESLKESGTPPIVEFIICGIEDEEEAYKLEEYYIRLYGRKGYEFNGILLNTCESSKPPNHAGKTYKDIYGEKWQTQIEKRKKAQLAVGGYGPKKHSEETKKKIGLSSSGRKANDNQVQNSRRMGLMNKGRPRIKKECSECKRMISINGYEQHRKTHFNCI